MRHNSFSQLFFLLFLTVQLLACSWAQEHAKLDPTNDVKVGKVTYFNASTQRNETLEKAIAKAFDIAPGTEVRYLYNRVALTAHDQHVIVMLPGQEFSGSGGSSAAVFQRNATGYALVTRFTLMRNPVLVASTSTKGWRDLVVRTSGGGAEAQFSRLRFNGKTYPSNPTSVDGLAKGSVVTGSAYLATPIGPDVGLLFKAP